MRPIEAPEEISPVLFFKTDWMVCAVRPITEEEILQELTVDGRDPQADEALVLALLLEKVPLSEGDHRGASIREEVKHARERYAVILDRHNRFKAQYDQHYAKGWYHGDAVYAERAFIEEVLTLGSRWSDSATGAADFMHAKPDAKKLFFYEHIAPALLDNGAPLPGTPDAMNAIQNACKTHFVGTPRALTEGEYATLAEFEADFEPMASAARSAMVFAGMGTRRATHDRSLRQIIDAINGDGQHAMRLDPARNSVANDYASLRLIAFRITQKLKDEPELLGRVRGPWAAKMFDLFDDNGEYVRAPHASLDEIRRFAGRSRGYRAVRPPVIKAVSSVPTKKRRKGSLTKEEVQRKGAEEIRLMAKITARWQAEEERLAHVRHGQEVAEEAEEEAWEDITELVLSMQADEAEQLLDDVIAGDAVNFGAYRGDGMRTLAERYPGKVSVEADVLGFLSALGIQPVKGGPWLTERGLAQARAVFGVTIAARGIEQGADAGPTAGRGVRAQLADTGAVPAGMTEAELVKLLRAWEGIRTPELAQHVMASAETGLNLEP